MTVATGAFKTYEAIGNREDLSDIIYNISPTDTPFVSGLKRKKAKSVLHEWQSDTLAAAVTTNAQLEGDDVSGSTSSPTTRVQNYCQIARKDVVISGTQEAVDKAGRDSEMALQIAKRGKELKRDVESALLANQGQNAGAAGTARKCRGLESWITTNASVGATGATATAATAAATDATAGDLRAFTETILKSAIQSGYQNGANFDKLMVGAYIKGVVSGFSGRSTQKQEVKPNVILGAADLYISDFGDIKVIPNRFQRPRTAFLLDYDYLALAELRPVKTMDLAKTGDSEKKFLLTEYTLEVHESAQGKIADLVTA